MKERVLTDDKISSFAIYLKNEEKSKNTIEKYIRDVKLFFAYVKSVEITKEKVIAYKNKLICDNYAIRSVNSMIASINSLFVFLGWLDLKAKNINCNGKYIIRKKRNLQKPNI